MQSNTLGQLKVRFLVAQTGPILLTLSAERTWINVLIQLYENNLQSRGNVSSATSLIMESLQSL